MVPFLNKKMSYCIVLFAATFSFVKGNSFLGTAEEMSCCTLATGSCRNICFKIPMVDFGASAEARENATRHLLEFCSLELVEFWNCTNATLKEMEKHENWTGRACCHLARNPICRSDCSLAGPKTDLTVFCRPSHEPTFTTCLERREEAERCCDSISNDTCRSICKDLYKRPGKQSTLKLYSSKGCFHQVPKCLKNAAETKNKNAEYPRQHLHCCEKTTNTTCLNTCRQVLATSSDIHEILDALERACSPVRPQSPMWSCFLQSASTKPARLPLDVGKLACCSKATRPSCQNLCWRAFQADWELALAQFEAECLSSTLEGELRRCLEDADDTCEMGCSGLSYCAAYNDKPTTLFRSCSSTADEAARWEADHWSRGGIIRGLGIPVRVAPSCPMKTLRAVACLLQLRPCESQMHESRLCREDCLDLMASCVDWSAAHNETPHTAATLCAKLTPARPGSACVSIKPFLEDDEDEKESPILIPEEDITTPCNNRGNDSPCPEGHICVLRNGDTKNYDCLKACSLGEMSKQLVPQGSWIQIPRFDQQGCHKICQCTTRGLEKCKVLNCLNFNFCWVQDRFIAHRSNFYLECNPCHCFEGEVTCSRRSCGELRIPSLPCDCPSHYVPVCSRLGVTYASTCLAKCAGLSSNDIEFGSCSSKNPCATNVCPKSSDVCVPKTRICLSSIYKPCPQFECVSSECDARADSLRGPVCDTNNREHPSLCALVRERAATLAYRGPCLKNCSLRGPICGANGRVYSSECAAWADRTVMDYFGSCIAVGLIGEQAKPRCGEAVICPTLAEPYCIGVTPPGACCPVCGGAVRLFYSKKQLDRIYHIMTEQSDKDTVTLEAMLDALSRQMQVSQCTLRGMVTPEGDIFIISQTVSKNPSMLQLRACVMEMEKLATRIIERSPRIVAEVPLSSLSKAEVVHTHVSSKATSNTAVIELVFSIGFVYFQIRHFTIL